MGCGDSRTPLTPEEALIYAEEEKLQLSSLEVSFVCTTVKKYSVNDIITDSQLLRILQRLVPDLDDHQSYKQRYFGETFFHAAPVGYSRTKLSILCLLLSQGSNDLKVHELFYTMNPACSASLDKEAVDKMVKTIVSISVVYCPLLAKSSSPMLADYKKSLALKAGNVTEAVVSYIMGRAHTVNLFVLTEKFNSKMLSRFLSPGGVRRTVVDFATVPGHPNVRHTHPQAYSTTSLESRSEKLSARREPYSYVLYRMNLAAHQTYNFCKCGRSTEQPFCDGTHCETNINPIEFEVPETGRYNLCGCKQSKCMPFCDKSHKNISW